MPSDSDVREAIHLIQLERRDVDREELGGTRQAAHFDVGHQTIDDTALVLDALGLELAWVKWIGTFSVISTVSWIALSRDA